jgi:hypothetical protein
MAIIVLVPLLSRLSKIEEALDKNHESNRG